MIRTGFPARPAFGTAVSEAILRRVAAGELPPTLRLHRPGRELAFSKHDRASTGFATAVAAARSTGFEPVLRMAGGRAAAFHEGTLAIAWATPATRPVAGTAERFQWLAAAIARALGGLGVDARIGAVAGEYCPGAWSVNARGERKLAGIGQRLIQGAAHAGGVVVVSGADTLRTALVPVYEALELDWDPASAGSVAEEVGTIEPGRVEAAILAELGRERELVEAEIDPPTLALAARLEASHLT